MEGGQHLLGLGVVGIDLEDDLANRDGLQEQVALRVDVDGAGECLDGLGSVAQLAQTFAQLERPQSVALVLFQRGVQAGSLLPVGVGGGSERLVFQFAKISHCGKALAVVRPVFPDCPPPSTSVAWGARRLCRRRTIAGGVGEAERQRAGWVQGVKGPKGGANPPRVPMSENHSDPERGKLAGSSRSPAPVGQGTGWARVQDAAHHEVEAGEGRLGSLESKAPHSYHVTGLHGFDQSPQGPVAGSKKRGLLGSGQLVRREIAAARLEERERAVVRHEERREESVRRAKTIARPTPQTAAADLAARTLEAQNRT